MHAAQRAATLAPVNLQFQIRPGTMEFCEAQLSIDTFLA